jgi:hypothetical protein
MSHLPVVLPWHAWIIDFAKEFNWPDVQLQPISNAEVLGRLGRVMTELRTGPANNKIDAAGHLTEYGAGCILDYLQSSCGCEIVQKAPT